MIRIVDGDLLGATAEYICHQVNCMGVMGSGVARQIREKWPHVYQNYHEATENYAKEHGREALLGKVQFVKVTERTSIWHKCGDVGC